LSFLLVWLPALQIAAQQHAPKKQLVIQDRTGKPLTVAQLLMRVSHHWAMHTGQIVYEVKARKPGGFEELWMKTMPNL
jgi:hypothetical protein